MPFESNSSRLADDASRNAPLIDPTPQESRKTGRATPLPVPYSRETCSEALAVERVKPIRTQVPRSADRATVRVLHDERLARRLRRSRPREARRHKSSDVL